MGIRRAFSLIELVVVLAIAAVLFALLFPAIQKVRGAAARIQCANNLRQIALGLHQYHDVHQAFPPGVTRVRGGAPIDKYELLSWRPRIMPFLEQQGYWRQTVRDYELMPTPSTIPFHTLIGQVMPVFGCPSDDRVFQSQRHVDFPFELALSSYLGSNGTDYSRENGVFHRNSRIRLVDVTDGASQTLLVGERPPSNDFTYGWLYHGTGQLHGSCDHTLGARELAVPETGCPPGPHHFKEERLGVPCAYLHFWSLHPGGAHFVYCDASVHFLTYAADSVLPALATRSGGEVAVLP